MMDWLVVLMIVFSVVAANHLGLVAVAESIIHHRLPVVNCPKCAAFWSVLAYNIATVPKASASVLITALPPVLAVAFLSAWSAIWLDLFMGIIDHLYLIIYEQIYPAANAADTDALSASDAVPDVPDGNG